MEKNGMKLNIFERNEWKKKECNGINQSYLDV